MPSAAELFSHHAFIDLETTGLDPATDEVIEVGVLLIEKGEVAGRISRLFRASAPLPLAIRRITGLRDEDLARQPAFSTFVPELRDALRGWTVVAHNAAFERGFLSELLESISAPVLDSCELLHYLYPERESHSLDSVVRWTGVGDRARHRALSDCEDTFGALCRALEQCLEEARAEDLLDLLDCLSSSWREGVATQPPLVELLRGLHALGASAPAPLELVSPSAFLPSREERRRRLAAPRRPDEEAPPLPVTDEEVEAVLGPGGALERQVEGFRSRPEQVGMAREVAGTLSRGGVLAVEAGTGTGKSLAYLTPAALFAARNGRKVAVAPHTKTLQDQLIEKDLPRLHRALDGAFGYSVLKGQNNYLCRRRALELTRVREGMSYEERAPRAYLRAYLRRSADGDLDRLSHWFKDHFPVLGTLLVASRSEAATTLGDTCPHYRRCFYHSAVAQAKEADVLVINQALALAWPQRYPRVDELILDEAHELEDVATTALAAEVSDVSLYRISERLLGRAGRGGGLASELRQALSGLATRGAARAFIRELEQGVQATLLRSQALGEALESLCGEGPEGQDADFSGLERRIDDAARASPAWAKVGRLLRELHAQVEGLAKKLSVEARASFPALASDGGPALERELAGAALELQELAALLAELTEEPPHPSRCYAAQVRPERGSWTLSAQPVEVSGFFKDQLAKSKRALVLTSATLSAGARSPWVLERLGVAPEAKEGAARFVRARSPFDLPRQALVILVTDAPRAARDEAFVDWSAQRIAGLAGFMGGRVLGLFSSTRRLERVGEKVRAQLEPLGIEVLRQSRGHARSLAARQEQDFGSVLLGTKSFWQGVDIPGLGVGLVFIDKLPIEPQSRPIVAAREERWAGEGRGGYQGFMHYRLPRALLLLRQGVGRLIRSRQDRGVVVIADPGHPGYRAQVLEALAGYRVEALPWELARVRIFHALKAMGLEARVRAPRSAPPTDVPGRLVSEG